MKTFVEMLQYGMMIIEGWFKWGIDSLQGKISSDAKYRLSICNECPFNKHGVCKECGCILKAKVRVDFKLDKNGLTIDGCPKNKW